MATEPGADAIAVLVQNALAASARSDSEAALALLRRAVERDDSAAVPHYLLGAEYARIGIVDKAIDETQRALERDARFADARFQLGLLHFTSGRLAQAESAWAPLASPPAPRCLRLFAQGLLAMAQDRGAEAKSLIASGIAANHTNEALNADMRGVIEAMDAAVEGPAGDAGTGHVLLSAYRSSPGGSA